MKNAAWTAYDGFRSRPAARAAAADLRAAMGDRWDVRMRTVADDALPYQVQTRDRAPEYMGHTNRATWVASSWLHNDHEVYEAVHDAARRAKLRERPWGIVRWTTALRAAFRTLPADARAEVRRADGAVDWPSIARDCRDECLS